MSDRGFAYDSRTQWSENHAPLRIAFGSGIVGAKDYPWVVPPAWADGTSQMVSDYGKDHPLPTARANNIPDNAKPTPIFCRLLDWQQMAILGLHAELAGVEAVFDGDGQLWFSGYQLHAAGLIDDGSLVTVKLSAKQRVELFGKSKPSTVDYMIDGLRCYAALLWRFIMESDKWARTYYGSNDPGSHAREIRWRAARWRREVIDRLFDLGIEDKTPMVTVSGQMSDQSAESIQQMQSKLRENDEIFMLAGGMVEHIQPADLPSDVREGYELLLKTLNEQGGEAVESLLERARSAGGSAERASEEGTQEIG